MNRRCRRREITYQLGVLILFGVLSSCSGTKPATQDVASDKSINPVTRPAGSPDLYLRLIKDAKAGHFAETLERSPRKPDKQGVSINFYTFEPVWLNQTERIAATCFVVPIPHCDVTSKNSAGHAGKTIRRKKAVFYEEFVYPAFGPFYTSSVNKIMTGLLNTAGLLLSYGLSAGSSDSIIQFDEAELMQTLQKAARSSGLTQEKRARIAARFSRKTMPPMKLIVQDHSGLSCGQADCLRIQVTDQTQYQVPSDLQALLADNSTYVSAQTITCSESPGYTVTVDCPPQLTDETFRLPHIAIPVIVHSKKSVTLSHPTSYAVENSDLKVAIDTEGLHLINKTQRYLMLEAISGYYSDTILTTALNFQLPPNGKSDQRLRPTELFPKKSKEGKPLNKRKDTTKQQLQAEHVTIGLAVKYSIVNSTQKKTLHDEKLFRAYDLLKGG
ncbi:MAG: hypothetical protein V3U84_06240 [Thiotrichaceae bacterium]